MALIKADLEALLSDSKEIKQKIDELQALNARLENLIGRIESSWVGDSSTTYINIMRGHMEKAKKMSSVLQEYKNYIDRAVDEFSSVDNNAASNIRGSF